MKKNIYLLFLTILMLTFVACGKEEEEAYDETTITFDKDGGIKEVIVESFDKPYYTEDGLRAFFQEKISDYTATNIGGGSVKLDELIVENGKAKATISYENSDAYKAFNGTSIFYGTVNEAYDKGYITETILKKNGSSDTITKIELMSDMKDNLIIVASEPIRIKCPKKITYISANVEIIDDKNARVSSDSTGLAYILID